MIVNRSTDSYEEIYDYYYPRLCTIDDFKTDYEKIWFDWMGLGSSLLYCIDDDDLYLQGTRSSFFYN